ncbi:MAG: glycosyl hydrolase 53 family protein [Chitinophagales bacterium]|nr:glycosyl hydrolase 53 family protein [Chitinophagales bacterium]
MRTLLFFIFIFFHCLSFSQRKKTSLDNDWKFAFGHANDPVKDFNYSIATIFAKTGAAQGTAIDPAFNDSAWRKLSLPHDWAVALPFVYSKSFDEQSHGYKPVGGAYPETSIGWYRKKFNVARSDSGQRFQIQFDGIYRDAACWINGFYLGNNKSGYVGASYDITHYLRYGQENTLVVRVDATQYEGWFYEGAGIYRHVWLNQYNPVHLDEHPAFVYTRVQNNTATVFIETSVLNESYAQATVAVSAIITDRDGKKIGETNATAVSLAVNETRTVKQSVKLSNPKLWSLEDPYLYRVIPVVRSGGTIIDSDKQRFGIRTIDIKPNGVFLNGQYIKLKGTNNHQDHAGVGSALPDYLQYYRIFLLKQMGSNAYRTSHNPPTKELLDACDSLGMLVMDENRLLNSSAQYMHDFEWLIKRDRSRASVFLWSIGNEEGWVHNNGTGKLIALSLLAKQKELDPTRTSTYAADNGKQFPGINEVIPVRSFNYRHLAVEEYHKQHPNQPLMGTEMGSTVTTRGQFVRDSIIGYLPDQDISFPWWASTAEAWWKLAGPNDYWLGGFVWTGLDYRGEPTPFTWPNINSHFGIMDMCGFPKNIYYYYQSWWTDKDVLHISPHWNWPGKQGQPIDVWVNSNADNVELFLNGKSLGKKDMPRNGHLQWNVNYEPGALEAIAYKKGRKLSTKVETTGKPFEVVVSPYKTTMLADGKDATVINISVIDREGREVPDANFPVHFSVQGDAKIIGVGNGDPSSHERDSYNDTVAQRRLFNGKCQVIVQAGTGVSMIHFEAKADSLWPGATDIMTILPAPVTNVVLAGNPFPVIPFKETKIDKMLGADISFLPELEHKGMKFYDTDGKENDAIQILKNHGLNYVRLRIFNNPASDSGYSPKDGFCDLAHTLQMAKRVKAAGMKLLLDFHYSDYWADPQKQWMPRAWRNKSFTELKKAVYEYTKMVVQALKEQGTAPDMVQVGNEINHGMIWPAGSITDMDQLAQLFFAGVQGVKAASPHTSIMLHIALGGQNDESRYFIDQMNMRGVPYDVIGLSYYPKWHNTLADLEYNLEDLSRRYNKDVIVVEYSHVKKEVNERAFRVPNGRGKGSCIWEPLSTWERFFDRDGKANALLLLYDRFSQQYLK